MFQVKESGHFLPERAFSHSLSPGECRPIGLSYGICPDQNLSRQALMFSISRRREMASMPIRLTEKF